MTRLLPSAFLAGFILASLIALRWSAHQEARFDVQYQVGQDQLVREQWRLRLTREELREERGRDRIRCSDDDAVLLYYQLQAHLRKVGKIDVGELVMAGGVK